MALPAPPPRKRKRAASVSSSGQTRPVDSNLLPFWNVDVAALSEQLWSPDTPAAPLAGENSCWFNVRTCSRPVGPTRLNYDLDALDTWLLTTEAGPAQVTNRSLLAKKRRTGTVTSAAVKTRKIRVYPATDHQRAILPKWFGTARWTYNQCVRLLQQPGSTYKATRSGGLRDAVVNDGNYENANQWVLDTPRDIRAGAYQDLLNAYSSNVAKKAKNAAHAFTIAFRSRKSPQERIYIDKRRYERGVIYPSKFGKVPLRSSEPLPAQLAHDAHLIRTRLGHYYLCITVDVKRDENQVPQRDTPRIAAIDPGVRTPHTLYDPAGQLIEFGKGDIGHLYRLCHHLDRLRSDIDLLPRRTADPVFKKYVHRKRWRMRKAWLRGSQRVRNLVDDYHKRVVNFLFRVYDIVLLPALETSRLALRKARKLTSKSTRAMVTWSHYRFRQRLLWKCRTTGCKVVVCGEAYTSKTCGCCGWLHDTLGGSKTFKCKQCGVEMDRDANAARNILLKNASRFGFRVEAALGLTPLRRGQPGGAWPSAASSFSNEVNRAT